ncbi:hypothetical protein TNCV_1084641 [Trichonephila clavipes]|nr:hypothetical protein TNCV_1084641 [Trichonephila clavipes]
MVRLSKTRPLPGHSRLGSKCEKNKLILACLHPPRSTTREAVCRSYGKNQVRGAYLDYTQNIMLQHQGEDPTGNPTLLSAALTLQQCLFEDIEERYHQPINKSRLTPATRLQ